MVNPKGSRGIRSIAIVDPGCRVPELGAFNQMSLMSSVPCSYHLPALFGASSMETLEKPLGIVIMGSGASVHETIAWQDHLQQWLWTMIKEKVPILGLCYGHQLLAHMFGGSIEVASPNKKKFLGVRTIQLDSTTLWGSARQVQVIVSHRETVTKCPEEFEIVGSSPYIAIEALSHKQFPIWSLQSHPEAEEGFIQNQTIPLPENFSVNELAGALNLVRQFFVYTADQAKIN